MIRNNKLDLPYLCFRNHRILLVHHLIRQSAHQRERKKRNNTQTYLKLEILDKELKLLAPNMARESSKIEPILLLNNV